MRKLIAILILSTACGGVTAADHAANVSEDALYTAALNQCRVEAKLQPKGTQLAYYHQCACDVDARFHADSGLCQ